MIHEYPLLMRRFQMEVIRMRTGYCGRAVSLSLLVLFLGLACNLIGGKTTAPQVDEGSTGIQEAPEGMSDESVPFQDAATPRDENKIILLSVEPAEDGSLAEIKMLLPAHLNNFEIVANDTPVKTLEEGKALVIDLTGQLSAKTVTFTFQSNDAQLATCTIMMEKLLNPEGDCIW
jgi:hypothetical protein